MMSRVNRQAVSFILERKGSSRVFDLTGRDAWALSRLIEVGEAGVTPLTEPGPRWSGYIFNLRRIGLSVETRHESHGGPFPGTHARYVLRDVVRAARPVAGDKDAQET